MQKLNYKDSGVDIAEGNVLVENLKGLVKSTFNANVLGGIGSFSGAYALPSGYKEPVILAATDGVGTKLRLAIDYGILNGVGIDLVAMCVNDLICNFATPLFFLDYYATGKLDKTKALEVIKGITQGCLEAQCALIGGETAEMPGMYEKEDFDLAGFAVGIGEKEIIQRGSQAKVGDVLIALPSSGIHSNGYSLVRKILTQNNIDLESIFEALFTTEIASGYPTERKKIQDAQRKSLEEMKCTSQINMSEILEEVDKDLLYSIIHNEYFEENFFQYSNDDEISEILKDLFDAWADPTY